MKRFCTLLFVALICTMALPSCKEKDDDKPISPQEDIGPEYKHVTLEAVDLGLTVKWASTNLGASRPQEYGDYFIWGNTQDKPSFTLLSDKWYNNKELVYSKYTHKDEKYSLELADDVANTSAGGNWRTPTVKEWTELMDNCDWAWTDNYSGSGVAGRIVTSRKNGQSIFLPAAGYRFGINFYIDRSNGLYWSSEVNPDITKNGFLLYFDSNSLYTRGNFRYYGYSVRAVTK